jgi:uncharacterized protein YcnI
MTSSFLSRVAIAVISLMVVVVALGHAHAVVYPRSSTTGVYERYLIRVPNERKVATTRVEIRFPQEIRVSSFSDVPGWQLEVLRDSAERIVGASWTGALAPERFVELPFVAVNPKEAREIVWPVTQLYADGERVEWRGPVGSKQPASVTNVSAVATPSAGANNTTQWIAVAALVLGLMSLGLTLRRRETPT